MKPRVRRKPYRLLLGCWNLRRRLSYRTIILIVSLCIAGSWIGLLTTLPSLSEPQPQHVRVLSLPTKTTDHLRSKEQATMPPVLPSTPVWTWVGLVRDATDIPASTWEALTAAACVHGVHVHVTVGRNAVGGLGQFQSRQPPDKSCAPFVVESEEYLGLDATSLPENRVERIAAIRDAQRQRVRQLWYDQSSNHLLDDAIIVVADLDLFRLPSTAGILEQAASLIKADSAVDVVCAAGVTMAARAELWYYDTYATVLLPDTYVHPLKRRLVPEFQADEDPRLVRSDNQHGSFTQGDLMQYLQKQAVATGTTRVRSCFGGLAIYRASTWFTDSCSYSTADPSALARYASRQDGRPCEHVVFHSCLQDSPLIPKARVAINPSLLALWQKN